mgnify:CR=1 FL=1
MAASKRVFLSKRLQRLQLQAEETPVEAPKQESDEASESQESETEQEDE